MELTQSNFLLVISSLEMVLAKGKVPSAGEEGKVQGLLKQVCVYVRECV